MGLDHYLERPEELPADRFAAWANDVQKVIDALLPSLIRGGTGVEMLIITDSLVRFGGNPKYAVGCTDDAIAIYADPARLAHFPSLPNTYSDGTPEPFHVARVFDQHYRSENARGWLRGSFRTDGVPYDIAVVAALILFTYHFEGTCRVHSDYPYRHWKPGLALAQRATRLPLTIPWFERGWTRARLLPAENFRAWRDDVARAIAIAAVPLAGPDGAGEPILTDTLVAFNGVGDDGGEPLRFSREYDPTDCGWPIGPGHTGEWLRGHVETGGNRGKRYDVVVAAALLLLAAHFPLAVDWREHVTTPIAAAEAESGGLGEEEWLPGMRLAFEATGRSLRMPDMWT